MAQYNEGTARISASNPQRVFLTGGITTENIEVGDLFRFQQDVVGFYYVGAIVDATTFDLTGDYVGPKAFDTEWDYLITRDFTPNQQLAETYPGDVDIREIFTYNMRKLDALLATPSEFAKGVRMPFDQDTPPLSWTRDISSAVNDRMIRIVTGTRTHGGSWTVTIGNHQHEVPATPGGFDSGQWERAAMPADSFFQSSGNGRSFGIVRATDADGIGGLPTLLSGPPVSSGDSSWRPLHRSMIIGIKD